MAEQTKILVVDDNKTIAESISDELQDAGYKTDVAYTGKDAIEKAVKNPFDVELLDISLPDIKGTEVLPKLKEINPDIMSIIITGSASLETSVDSLRKGAFDYITKLLDLKQLMEVVKKAVEKRKVSVYDRELLSRLENANKELQQKITSAIEELMTAQKKLSQTEKIASLGQAVATVAHELRTPMCVIRSWVEVMGMNIKEGDPNKRHADVIIRETDRLNRIVNEMLTFSREQQLDLRFENINQLVKQSLLLVQNDLFKYNVKCSEKLDATRPSVNIDPDKIKQIIINIVQNACHAMDKCEVRQLNIQTSASEGFIHMEISDTGAGIPAEKLDSIFKPFFTTKANGTGLGLSICKSIVEAHRGKIEVKSQLNLGTAFIISLPMKKEYSGPEQRQYIRRNAHLQVRYRYPETQEWLVNITKDISAGGILLVTEQEFSVDDYLELEIELPGINEPIKTAGKIVRVKQLIKDKLYENGIKFAEINSEHRQIINRFTNLNKGGEIYV